MFYKESRLTVVLSIALFTMYKLLWKYGISQNRKRSLYIYYLVLSRVLLGEYLIPPTLFSPISCPFLALAPRDFILNPFSILWGKYDIFYQNTKHGITPKSLQYSILKLFFLSKIKLFLQCLSSSPPKKIK